MTEKRARIRYVFNGTAISVQERFEMMGGRKGTDGQTEIIQRSVGWFVQLSTGASLCLGPEKPDIAQGDTVRMTIEAVA
jgi:hypothetical protein